MNSAANEKVIAVFPGAFDPVTEGHLDIINRGSKIFNKLIVAVGKNPEKRVLFEVNEKIDILRELTTNLPNVEVHGYEGLTIDFVKKVNGRVILKGIRDSVDLRYELQQANTNRLAGGIETLFVLAGEKHALTSSTLIKQIVAMGGDASSLVPPQVADRLKEKLARSKQNNNEK